MADLEDIVPIIGDEVAIKILSLVRKTRDPIEIAQLTGLPHGLVQMKVALILRLGLVNSDGTLTEPARNLVLATATSALKGGKRK